MVDRAPHAREAHPSSAMLEKPSASDEPNPKRARIDGGDGSTSLGPKLKAREVVELRFVHNVEDIDTGGAAGPHDETKTFSPTFLHQIFPKEEILGYTSAKLAVYVDPLTLATWIDETSEPFLGVEDSKRTPLKKTVAPFIRDGLYTSRAEFENAVNAREHYIPPAENRVRDYYSRNERFGVFKEKLSCGNAALHKRICFFMFVHIDGASFIDASDPRWELFLVHKIRENGDPGEFVGYATTYPFSAMRTEKIDDGFLERLRISQVFVMPAQQGRGHGARLLESIYEDAVGRKAMEVTVEDPSPGFRLLRDLVDLRRSYKKEILQYKCMLDYEKTASVVQEMGKKLLITPSQARRCVEVHQLIHVDKEDEAVYKKYRLWVKRRLYTEYLEVLNFQEGKETEEEVKEARKAKLTEIYSDIEKEYVRVVDRLAKRGPIPSV